MGLDMYIRDEYGNDVAYWRKFNALHSYLVKNLQEGNDDCQPSRNFTTEDVENILYILKQIKKNPVNAKLLMPTTEGFFFGSTQYDEYFMQDVKNAIKSFQEILEEVKIGCKFYYQSSW
jgi:hypothetical protein